MFCAIFFLKDNFMNSVLLGKALQGSEWSYSVCKFMVKNKTTSKRFFSFLLCESVTSLFRKGLDQ